jgi:hypothetical protein
MSQLDVASRNLQQGLDANRQSFNTSMNSIQSNMEERMRELVGSHYHYIEQVGGMTAGLSAGVGGVSKAGAKVNELKNNFLKRKARRQRGQNPNEDTDDEDETKDTPETEDDDTDTSGQGARQGTKIGVDDDEGEERENEGDEDDEEEDEDEGTEGTEAETQVGTQAEAETQGSISLAGRDLSFPQSQAGEGGTATFEEYEDGTTAFENPGTRGISNPSNIGVDSLDTIPEGDEEGLTGDLGEDSGRAASQVPDENLQTFKLFDTTENPAFLGNSAIEEPLTKAPTTTAPTTTAPITEAESQASIEASGSGAGADSGISGALSDAGNLGRTAVSSLTDAGSGLSGAVSGGVSAGVSAGTDVSTAGGIIADGLVAGAGAMMEAVPVVGTLAGLGALIYGFVEGEKKDDDVEAPTVSTEESGGFDASALYKGATAGVGAVL